MMIQRDEFEILRGEKIVSVARNEDIPCHETSDEHLLCKHPVVSVYMTAYNHMPYIRQALESVVNQTTDFEYEVVVGEDASTDDTRSVCFEFQKRYPEKVRVLWSEKNVYNVDGNEIRTKSRCRGEFFAYCEGDDYWTDPMKLQKQVDIMRQHPNVGMVFCDAFIDYTTTGQKTYWNREKLFPVGVIPGHSFMIWHLFGRNLNKPTGDETFLMTASVMLRRNLMLRAMKEYEIFQWRFHLSDTTVWLAMASYADMYYMPAVVSAYRQLATGECRSNTFGVWRDAQLVRLWFAVNVLPEGVRALPRRFVYNMLIGYYHRFKPDTIVQNRQWLRQILGTRLGKTVWGAWYNWPILIPLYLWGYTPGVRRWVNRFSRHFQQHLPNGRMIERIYKSL